MNQQENRTTVEVNIMAEELLDKTWNINGIRNAENGKASGIDEVVPECLKTGGKKLTR